MRGASMIQTKEFKAVNLQRHAVLKNEVLTVVEGFTMVCECRVLVVRGYVRLYGVLRIGTKNA